MRETKFRAWDDIEKRWLTHAEVCNGLVFRDDGWVGFLVEHLHLMQYTGLKDKDGVEIYEGDIVGYRDGEWSFDAVIKWGDWGWCMRGIEPNDNFNFDDTEPRELEVIGNIYENPELLEQPNAK